MQFMPALIPHQNQPDVPDDGLLLPDAKMQAEIKWADSKPGWWPWLIVLCATFAVLGLVIMWLLNHANRIPK